MKLVFRILPLLGLLAAVLPAAAQGSAQPMAQPWTILEKELGLPTTYSVDMVIQSMGMNMTSRVYRHGDLSRTEMTMPFMNTRMVGLEIPRNGRTLSYLLVPEKKKYVLQDDASGLAQSTPAIEELGTEMFNGVECTKRRMKLDIDGLAMEMVMLFSPAVQGMPVKITVDAKASLGPGQPEMPVQSTLLFQNYDFSTPDASLFQVPADYTEATDMMSLLMEDSGMGALMQQFQDMPFGD